MVKVLTPDSLTESISLCMRPPDDGSMPCRSIIILDDNEEAAEFVEAFLYEQKDAVISDKFVLREQFTNSYNAEIVLDYGKIYVFVCDHNLVNNIRTLLPDVIVHFDKTNSSLILKTGVDCLYSESVSCHRVFSLIGNEFMDDRNSQLTEFLDSFKILK